MRALSVYLCGVAAALAFSALPVSAEPKKTVEPADNRLPGHEPDTYRFGYPYNTMRGTSPGQCEASCNRDDSCQSWSFVPATFNVGPRCELKRNIGSAEYRPGGVSGIALRYHPRPQGQMISQPVSAVPQPRATYRPAPQSAPRPMPQMSAPATPQIEPKPRPVAATPPPQPRPERTPDLLGGPIAPQAAPQPMPQPVRREVAMPAPQPAPKPAPPAAQATLPQGSGGVQIDPPPPPIQARRPWTERSNGDPAYSVRDMDYIPGDEQATAGFINPIPEE